MTLNTLQSLSDEEITVIFFHRLRIIRYLRSFKKIIFYAKSQVNLFQNLIVIIFGMIHVILLLLQLPNLHILKRHIIAMVLQQNMPLIACAKTIIFCILTSGN